MVSLEELLLTIRAKNEVVVAGETYSVKNMVSAADGTTLKARLLLYKPEKPACCINIDISTQVYELPILN